MEFTEERILEKELEIFEDEGVDHVEKRAKPKARVTLWKWGRCGRICRDECLMEVHP